MVLKSRVYSFEFDWIIEQFSTLETRVVSEVFNLPTDRTKWYVYLYPDGDKEESKGYLSLYITAKETLCNIAIELELHIISLLHQKTKTFACKVEMPSGTGHGWSKFIARKEVFDQTNAFLVDDNLTIYCKLTIPSRGTPQGKGCLLIKQQQLLKSGEYNDCVFTCPDGEVTANKFLLASQSSMFRAMFLADTEEAKTGKVKIVDTNKDVMTVLIEYTSCGTVFNLDDIVDRLLPVADKYDMDDLQQICAKRMCETIAKENACGRLILADLHNIESLKKAAIKFFQEDSSSLSELPGSDKLDQKLLFLIADSRRKESLKSRSVKVK